MNLTRTVPFVMSEFEQVRACVDPVIDDLASRNRDGHAINISTLQKKLSAAFAPFDIKLNITEREDVSPKKSNYPYLGGGCDFPDSKHVVAPVEVDMIFDPNRKRLLWTNGRQWDHFRFRLYTAIQHELVHRYQFKQRVCRKAAKESRIFKPHKYAEDRQRADQIYLGEHDEIEAYALDIVNEWWYYIGTPFTLRDIKKEFRSPPELRVPSLKYYAAVFDHDINHPAVQRLFRKIRQWNAIVTPLAESLPSCPISVRTNLKWVAPA